MFIKGRPTDVRFFFPYIELDAIHWQANWEELETEALLMKLRDALKRECWVLDGNYSRTNRVKWARVDTIVWLDYGFFRTFKQILCRSIKRACSKNEIWKGTGNTESFRRSFLSRESVILWMLTNFWKTKAKYKALSSDERVTKVQIVHFRSPKEAESFLNHLPLGPVTKPIYLYYE